jgi:signal transduction histidine kinase
MTKNQSLHMQRHSSADKRPWTRWAIGFAVVTAAGVLFGLQFYVSNSQLGGTSPASAFIYDQLLYWYTWGILFPVLFWLARKIPVEPPRRGRALAAHGAIGILAAYLHASLYISLYHAFSFLAEGIPFSSESVVQGFFRLNMPMRIVNYYLIVAGIFAAEFYQKFTERRVAASRLETELAVAKIQMMRMQMQPHFLFNALHAIAGLVRAGERSQAVAMIAGLSDLLRTALEAGDAQQVPLERELQFARKYLEIERVRFSDRLTVEVESDTSLGSLPVPNLLLQPLVENAIHHGVARRPGAGRIGIRTMREGEILRIEVWDDGAGPPEEWDIDRDAGIGLRNTRERLRHLYGSLGALRLERRPGGGAAAVVTLPVARGTGDAP